MIPQGWEEKRLGDVCLISAGNSAPQDKTLFEAGIYPFFRTADVGKIHFGKIKTSEDLLNEKSIKGLKLFKKGTILIPKSGASTFLNHRVKMEADGFVVSHLATVKGHENVINDDFLLYYLSIIKVQDLIQDQNYPSLNLPIISNIKIMLPPLSEQERIVAKLDEAFEAIDKVKANAEKKLNNAKELFDSYVNDTYTKLLFSEKIYYISDIAKIKGGKRVPKGYKLKLEKTAYPYIRVADFNDYGSIDLSDIHYITEDIYQQISNYTISKKDLYISIAGTIGKSGIIPDELEGANLTENACKLVFSDRVYNKFVYYFTKTRCFIYETQIKTRTAAQPKLALSRLATIKIPLPDIKKQQKIVEKLDIVHEQIKLLEQIYIQKIKECAELKQSILQKAFRGEL